eukprot:TRINITY_DN38756_c0_g2_i1.p1 TRINITY_DN38756_c0_g2~~TRINITY_DN38756_c0_g2_i1.p1  ORF type:complete len:932 (-),score=217.78 TRINITY_DN38756_c0_g2_i1:38-2446(-)
MKKGAKVSTLRTLMFNEKEFWKVSKEKTPELKSRSWDSYNAMATNLNASERKAFPLLRRIWSNPYMAKSFLERSDLPATNTAFDAPPDEVEEWWSQNCGSIRLKRKPFKYQLQQVFRMAQVEAQCETNQFHYFRLDAGFLEFRFSGKTNRYESAVPHFEDEPVPTSMQLIFDPITSLAFPRFDESTAEEFALHSPLFSVKGGILADEVGLGKTFSSIMLCALNQRETKYLRRDGVHFRPLQVLKGRIVTGATLFACPNTLIKQIESEILGSMRIPPEKLIVISTKTQHEKFTAFDIAQAQIVLVSYNFLGGPYYNGLFSNHWCLAEYQEVSADFFDKCAPSLDCFHWHRVMVDEAHELFDDYHRIQGKKYMEIAAARLIHYTANFKWAITATPFSRPECQFTKYCDFLNLRVNGFPLSEVKTPDLSKISSLFRYSSSADSPWLLVLGYLFERHIVFRSTKASVGEENKIPQYQEKVVHVDLCPQERLLHDCCLNIADKLAICCSPLLFADVSAPFGVHIDEIYSQAVARLKNQVSSVRNYISWTEERLNSKRVILTTNGITHETSESQVRQLYPTSHYSLIIAQQEVRNLLLTLRKEQSKLRIYSKSVSVLENNRPPPRDVVDREAQLDTTIFSQNFWDMITTYWGTKLSMVCQFVHKTLQDESARIIIFSAFDPILSCLENLLGKLGIKVGCCKGNVFVKGNLLKAFRDGGVGSKLKKKPSDSPRVLAMSLAHSASGADLLSCSHIILVDTLIGTKQYVTSTEMQAIGRACRQGQERPATIIRFLCNDSEEMSLFVRRQSQ